MDLVYKTGHKADDTLPVVVFCELFQCSLHVLLVELLRMLDQLRTTFVHLGAA